MCWVQHLTSSIQLCISILETVLHVTMKRRVEISAEIFARLVQYFRLSCKNLTIINSIDSIRPGKRGTKTFNVRHKLALSKVCLKVQNFTFKTSVSLSSMTKGNFEIYLLDRVMVL